MIKRSSLKSIENLLSKNPDWKILDIGCGYTANKFANTVADVQDLKEFYKNKKFVQILEKKLPFKDNEFDFIISSHVIEHVEDINFFVKELERISKKGMWNFHQDWVIISCLKIKKSINGGSCMMIFLKN